MSSAPYLMVESVFAALQAETGLVGAKFLNNPTSPASLRDGDLVVFLEDGEDDLIDKPNQRDRRTFSFTVGIISRSLTPRVDADEAMVAAKLAVLGNHSKLIRDHKAGPLRHRSTRFRLEELDVGGALRLMLFETEYSEQI